MKKTLVLLTCTLALAGCGGGGSRPTADELSKTINDKIAELGIPAEAKGSTDKMVDCMAKGAVDSKMSNGSLNAMADGKDKIDADDQKIFTEVTQKCVKDMMKDLAPSN